MAKDMAKTKLYSVSETPFGSLILHDAPAKTSKTSKSHDGQKQDHKELEIYFNDLYKMFLKKFTAFEAKAVINNAEKQELKAMFQELIDVKSALHQ